MVPVQYLRAIAALMVVAHHAKRPREWLFNALPHVESLAAGVDIFFVISGFVMFVSARNEAPLEFVRKRIIRIVPLYWASTLLLLAMNSGFQPWRIPQAEQLHILKSLLFWPHPSPSNPGEVWPYLVPGWTLNLEIFFYAIYGLGLLFRRTLGFTTVAIVVLLLLGYVWRFENALALTYTSPRLLEFLCGVWIGWLYERGRLPPYGFVSLVAGSVALWLSANEIAFPQAIAPALSSSLIVAGAVSLGNRVPDSSLLNLLGNASYSIYLTHGVVSLRVAERLSRQIPLEGWAQFTAWMFVSLALSSIVGIVVYEFFERPALRWLRSVWTGPARLRS